METVEKVEAPISIKGTEITQSSLKWASVVAYRFALPDEENTDLPRESGFSLIARDGSFDIGALTELKRKEAILTPNQVSRLVDAVYGSHEKTGSAACYDPHHIFLFYDSSDVLIHVVEVCFGCTNLSAQPQIKEPQWGRHDFRELARLCDEVGIGMTSGTAEDQIRFWDERDKI